MLKSLAILSVLAIGATAAHASAITGTLAADGANTFTSSTLTFFNPETIFGGSLANTGSFSVLTNGTSVTFFPTLTQPDPTFPYLQGQHTVISTLNPLEAITVTSVATLSQPAETFDFFMTDYNADFETQVQGCTSVVSPVSCLTITGNGYWTESGGPNLSNSPGNFTFSSTEQANQATTTFQATGFATPAAVTPEPASLALVGSGLIGLVAFARRKGFALNK